MIEEAAGTKMYEDKKEGAVKTLEKKDRKVNEITQILDETITPTLKNLEKQQKQYQNWLEFKREKEKLEKIRVAFEYYQSKRTLSGSEAELKDFEKQIAELEQSKMDQEKLLKKIKSKLLKLAEAKEKDMSSGLQELEQEGHSLSKKIVRIESGYKNCEDNLKNFEKELEDLKSTAITIQSQIKEKQKNLEHQTKILNEKKLLVQEKKEHLENLKRQYQAVSVGVAADGEGTAKTLADQLMDAKKKQVTSSTEAQSCAARIAHSEKELKNLELQTKKIDSEYKQFMSEEKTLKSKVKDLEEKISQLGFSEQDYQALLLNRRKLQVNIKEATERSTGLKMKLDTLNFSYKDPAPNFDRSKVHGRVASLINLRDPKHAIALEIAGGARLRFVVVEDEKVSQQLIENGKLQQRETIIPLSKITSQVLSDSQLKTAWKQVGKPNVASAVSLVEYDKKDESAIEYVYGSTLVCQTSEQANSVTFHPQILARSVTLEGDVFDAAGTLTGGAVPSNINNYLALRYEYLEKKKEILELQKQLQETETKIKDLEDSKSKHEQLANALDLENHSYQFFTKRMEMTQYHQSVKKVEELKLFLESERLKLKKYSTEAEEAEENAKSIEHQIQNFNKEDQLTKTKQNISKAKKQFKELSDDFQQSQQSLVRLESQIAELTQELKDTNMKIEEFEKELISRKEELKERGEKKDKFNKEYEKILSLINAKKSAVLECDSNIAQLVAQRDANTKAITDAELNIKKLEHKIENFKAAKESAKKTVSILLKQHEWIESEEQEFGKPNTDYDFDKSRMKEVIERLSRAEEGQEKLSKQINKKAVHMFEKAQQEYNELIKKKKQIEADKAQIQNFIKELDKKKNEALQTTWEKVNKDFGSIFSSLLPGAQSKLEPQEGHSFLDGLVVKVAFGGVWKDSLSELSGGQRSLVSLSLVLSLLLFKPAPMYILDEIDSALDLSHTQNIGEMIKTHFTQSQFIVISLKEGMYNNANVLFSVKNVNGASVVTRTEAPKTAKKPKKRKRAED
eukprot:TRINITY_DN15993_c0_g1_i1.p1 TRINITY_DN15993_c0_g1~~TRINITY_DN15993_c0_g1_i1.p1  ORF type:complete len:1200 (-),score=360.67 TRINITY_DN15993_c0_g1_i1:64-3138(-)